MFKLNTLIACRCSQNEANSIQMVVCWSPNPDAQAWKSISMEMLNNACDPIMASSASTGLELYSSDGKIHFVIDDQEVIWLEFVPALQFSDCLAAIIHISEW